MSDSQPPRSAKQLRDDALAIWHAGLDAVKADRLVMENVHVSDGSLVIGGEEIPLEDVRRIVVVGGGKAGAGMAVGLERALGQQVLAEKHVCGWINIPEGSEQPTQVIRLHPARPVGLNEPTEEGVAGTREILQLVSTASKDDLVICLLSGGGSALMPGPVDGISLSDKQSVTRFLSGAGANIAQLNTVRKHLSSVKGGGLARAYTAGKLITLIISDVLGDPLDVIASGPTVADSSTPQDALAILEQFDPDNALPAAVYTSLRRDSGGEGQSTRQAERTPCSLSNLIIGNNAIAVDAAGMEAERRGYSHAMHAATSLEGDAESVGRHLAKMALRMRRKDGPDCLITGGEPIVQLAKESVRGKGGRNQQLVLAAAIDLIAQQADSAGVCLLSAGTDGEDGPTDAAGALFDAAVANQLAKQNLDPLDFIRRNDAYHFFAPLDGLIKTGPTNTNVCDIRVVVVDRREVNAAKGDSALSIQNG